ncbi:YcaO-like family protein [Kitasatospora viridis]|uniref:Ribosomal protein S12 methylthiotransferase accessory factor n=1 Tax=Kitasatospora viridis TaxID=281105 RepID=A0A561SDI9_9ACTN|nr:YcaO-like family protein [Kitasatospora viridis]TWF72914.1 ribosomal protein S12 methylthiotransferase accessory factor [Kitasatospora viridis]
MTTRLADTEPHWPVQTFAPFPAAPALLFARTAARSRTFSASDAANGEPVLIGSAAGTDPAEVAVRARGELAERVGNVLAGRCAEAGGRGSVTGGYQQLRRRGRPALDPLAWPELRDTAADLRSAELLWVPGESLDDGREVLVPACAAYLAHRPPPGCAAPLRPGSTGLAAHRTRPEAARHAALEVLERHLLWHAWYADGPCERAEFALPPVLRGVLAALGLRATFLLLPGPASTACVLACLHAPDGTGQTFGARADTGGALWDAARAACHEALMVRWSLGTAAARTAWQRLRSAGGAPPDGPLEHALHAYHRQDSLARLLDGARTAATPRPTGQRPADPAEVLAGLTGHPAVLVDTTSPGVPGADAAVVRLVAPGARRLPSDERAHRAPSGARTRLPHPLG